MIKASVIIPHFNRHEYLKRVINALMHQSMSDSLYEIVVVDDGSTPCFLYEKKSNLKIIRNKKQGAAAARNLGCEHAQGDVVIYLDCDILVDPSFIETHLEVHQKMDEAVVVGPRIHLDPEGNAYKPEDTRQRLLRHFGKKFEELNHPWFMAYTCNVSLKRNLAITNKFDEAFRVWGLEDSEWAYRLFKKGAIFTFAFETEGKHMYHDRSLSMEKFIGWQKNLDIFLSKHPEMSKLKCFIDVFDPRKNGDYFEAYHIFEGLS